jgi:hypothetical protein
VQNRTEYRTEQGSTGKERTWPIRKSLGRVLHSSVYTPSPHSVRPDRPFRDSVLIPRFGGNSNDSSRLKFSGESREEATGAAAALAQHCSAGVLGSRGRRQGSRGRRKQHFTMHHTTALGALTAHRVYPALMKCIQRCTLAEERTFKKIYFLKF